MELDNQTEEEKSLTSENTTKSPCEGDVISSVDEADNSLSPCDSSTCACKCILYRSHMEPNEEPRQPVPCDEASFSTPFLKTASYSPDWLQSREEASFVPEHLTAREQKASFEYVEPDVEVNFAPAYVQSREEASFVPDYRTECVNKASFEYVEPDIEVNFAHAYGQSRKEASFVPRTEYLASYSPDWLQSRKEASFLPEYGTNLLKASFEYVEPDVEVSFAPAYGQSREEASFVPEYRTGCVEKASFEYVEPDVEVSFAPAYVKQVSEDEAMASFSPLCVQHEAPFSPAWFETRVEASSVFLEPEVQTACFLPRCIEASFSPELLDEASFSPLRVEQRETPFRVEDRQFDTSYVEDAAAYTPRHVERSVENVNDYEVAASFAPLSVSVITYKQAAFSPDFVEEVKVNLTPLRAESTPDIELERRYSVQHVTSAPRVHDHEADHQDELLLVGEPEKLHASKDIPLLGAPKKRMGPPSKLINRGVQTDLTATVLKTKGGNTGTTHDVQSSVIQTKDAKTDGVTSPGNVGQYRHIKYLFGRCVGLLDIPLIFFFGIVLYLVDVGSDIMAAVDHFQEGHPLWGSLTITFVILPALCWAAVSRTWWKYDRRKDEHPKYRRKRMLLSSLLLDPLTRQLRVLWFTYGRERIKWRRGCNSNEIITEAEREKRMKSPKYPEYWERRLNEEDSYGTYLSAIATFVEDAPEIILLVYIIGRGNEQEILDYVQLATSMLSIFYTTAQFPQQVRLQKSEDRQIETVSMATVALLTWRTLIVGSRMLAFILFALLFHYWLFVIIAVHYLLMYALVFYQHRFTAEKSLTQHAVYNVVTPFIYIFDFCLNVCEGPSRYWCVMCYVPMYCENLLMSGLGLWFASTTPSPAWYIVPGCVAVIVMFPIGVLAQVAYYRYWHPNPPFTKFLITPIPSAGEAPQQPIKTSWYNHMTWSEFRSEVRRAQDKNRPKFLSRKYLMQVVRVHDASQYKSLKRPTAVELKTIQSV